MEERKPHLYLNAFLAKGEHASLEVSDFLKGASQVNAYDLDSKHELEAKLFGSAIRVRSPISQ